MSMLELFTTEAPAWGVTDAGRALGLPKSTTSELMTSLAEQGLLRRTTETEYRLGWRLLEFGRTQLATSGLEGAKDVMNELADLCHETVHLAALEGMRTVYIAKVQPRPRVRIDITYEGARLPTAHCSAVGKMLLASEPDDRLSRKLKGVRLQRYTTHTIVDRAGLEQELDVIRDRGYAYDVEEIVEGLCCIAVPVRTPDRTVVAAISLSAPESRFWPNLDYYAEALDSTALRVTSSASEFALKTRDSAGAALLEPILPPRLS